MKKLKIKSKKESGCSVNESKLRIVKSNKVEVDEKFPRYENIIYGRIKSIGKIKVLVMVDNYGRSFLHRIT